MLLHSAWPRASGEPWGARGGSRSGPSLRSPPADRRRTQSLLDQTERRPGDAASRPGPWRSGHCWPGCEGAKIGCGSGVRPWQARAARIRPIPDSAVKRSWGAVVRLALGQVGRHGPAAGCLPPAARTGIGSSRVAAASWWWHSGNRARPSTISRSHATMFVGRQLDRNVPRLVRLQASQPGREEGQRQDTGGSEAEGRRRTPGHRARLVAAQVQARGRLLGHPAKRSPAGVGRIVWVLRSTRVRADPVLERTDAPAEARLADGPLLGRLEGPPQSMRARNPLANQDPWRRCGPPGRLAAQEAATTGRRQACIQSCVLGIGGVGGRLLVGERHRRRVLDPRRQENRSREEAPCHPTGASSSPSAA